MIESCITCRFWSPVQDGFGQCRRNAPTAEGHPKTPMQHWCGEYEVFEVRQKPFTQKISEFLHGEVNASVHSESTKATRVVDSDRCKGQCLSKEDSKQPDRDESELPQPENNDDHNRASGTVSEDQLIESVCYLCEKKFKMHFESAVCNICYKKKQGRERQGV